MAIKAVLFDLDDTLYEGFHKGDEYAYEKIAQYAQENLGVSGEAFAQEFRQARKRLARQQPGLPAIHDRILSAQHALESMGLNAIRYARDIHRVYWDAMFQRIEPRPGVYKLLDELKGRGIKTAVCTDMLTSIQMKKLEFLGMADRIDYLVTSEEASIDKPAAAVFWLALHKCAVLPHEAVMIGDDFEHDMEGAHDIGMQTIWLNWKGLSRPDVSFPYVEVSSMEEVAQQLRQML